MGKVLKIYIACVIVFSLCLLTFANPDDYSGGGSSNTSNLGKGGWAPNRVAMKVSILTENNVVRTSQIFTNAAGKTGKFASPITPKMHQGSSFDWKSNITTYQATFLPSNWIKSDNNSISLYSILADNNYTNLKALLESAVLKDYVGPNDYIVVEPMTYIGGYYATAYEFATAFNLDSNCGTDGSFCWVYNGVIFGGSSNRPTGGIFRTTIYLSSDVPQLGLYSFKGSSYKEKRAEFMLNSGGLGIGVFKYNEVYKGGQIEIKKYSEGSNKLIASSAATFQIYNQANCTGSVVDTISTGNSGVATSGLLDAGTYSISEQVTPSGYIEPTNKCVKNSVTIVAGQNTSVDIYNTPACSARLDELGTNPTVSQLLELYKAYPQNTNLLNFSNPSCSQSTCDVEKANITGCLSAKNDNSTFNESNLSCFDEKYTDYLGNVVAFCKNIFELKNNLGVNKFYGKSGQFLIKKTSPNTIQIFNDKLNPVTINVGHVATATINKVCYTLNGSSAIIDTQTTPSLSVYFNDENKALDSNVNVETSSAINVGAFTKTSNKVTYNYKLKYVYLEKLTGKVFDSKTPNTGDGIEGIVSPFNKTGGTIYFDVIYNGKNAKNNSGNLCTYETKQEIIVDDDLDIEFRTIDTEKPFERETNANWCNGNDCSENNNVVKDYINKRVNSYGLDFAGTAHDPIYKIILTPSDIQTIRNYNSDNKYDYYRVINANNKIINAFVHSLKNGVLNRYDADGDINKSYGMISKLTGTKTE